MSEVDFDHWCELARRQPEHFFRERERVIGRFIDAHPPAQAERLRELQSRIDDTRAVAGNPLRAAKLMLGLMEDNLEALQSRLLCLQRETDHLVAVLAQLRGRP